MSVSLFEFVKSLTETKVSLLDGNERDYSPFIIEKALSMGMRNLFFVNEMNIRPGIAKRHHHDFLMAALPKGKQYNKWAKKSKDGHDSIVVVMDYYKVSEVKAAEIIKLLSDEQMEILHNIARSKELN